MTKSKDPDEVISELESELEKDLERAEELARWFIERSGEVYEWEECVDILCGEFDLDRGEINRALIQLTDDSVDPVQVISSKDKRCIGCLEYTEGEGWYGYVEYHSKYGKRKNVVCAKCIQDEIDASSVYNPVDGEGRYHRDISDISDLSKEEISRLSSVGGKPAGHSFEKLSESIEGHYKDVHPDADISKIEVGASLVSGTTIDGSTAWHDGNVSGGSNISIGATSVSVSPQGATSGLNADTVDGSEAADLGGIGPSSFQFISAQNQTTNQPNSLNTTITPATPFYSYLLNCNVNITGLGQPLSQIYTSFSTSGGDVTRVTGGAYHSNAQSSWTITLKCFGLTSGA